MYNTLIKKIKGDIFQYKSRSMFILLGMIMGITVFGVVLISYSILNRELLYNYMVTEPASLRIETETLSKEMLQKVKTLSCVKDASVYLELTGKIMIPSKKWLPLTLKVFENFENIHIDRITQINGAWPPKPGEILLEKDVFAFIDFVMGQSIELSAALSDVVPFTLKGVVHDPGEAPAHMENCVYGYISAQSLPLLNSELSLNTLQIVIAGDRMDESLIKESAQDITDFLNSNGVTINKVIIPKPGKHPHFSQMGAFLFIIALFGVCAFILSTILMVNLISSILVSQIKQVGILKAIGATEGQVNVYYMVFTIIFSLVSLLIGLPLSMYFSRVYAKIAAIELNFIIYDSSVPISVYVAIITVAMIVPLIMVLFAIVDTTYLPTLQLLNFTEVSADKRKQSLVYRFISRISGINRIYIVSIQNAFRKKKRIMYTLLILSLGGTFFISTYIIRESMQKTINQEFKNRKYDIELILEEHHDEQSLALIFNTLPEIENFECIQRFEAVKKNENGGDKVFPFIGINPNSQSLDYPMNEGHWFVDSDSAHIVFNPMASRMYPHVACGMPLVVNVDGIKITGTVIGIVNEIASPPALYMPKRYLQERIPSNKSKTGVFIQIDETVSVNTVLMSLEMILKKKGIKIKSSMALEDRRKAIDEHLVVVIEFLRFLSLFLVATGALTIISTMSMNLLERKREFGIMRSLGATPYKVILIVMIEALVIAGVSYILSNIIAFAVGFVGTRAVTSIMLNTVSRFSFSIQGAVIWFIINFIFVAGASLFIACRASMVPVAETLSYE